MYLTYADYQNMGGTLEETAFNDLEFAAEAKVNWYTFNRLKKEDPSKYPEELKRCMYRIIKLIDDMQKASSIDGQENSYSTSTAGVASMSNDGVSISYNVLSASEAVEQAGKQVEQCIKEYLSDAVNSLGQKLLYKGFYPGE